MQAPKDFEVQRRRLELRRRLGGRFVDVATYKRLLVSNRRLVREDHPLAGVRGLRDLRDGTLFLIEDEAVFAPLGWSA